MIGARLHQHPPLAALHGYDLSTLASAAQRGKPGAVDELLKRVQTIAHRYSFARLGGHPASWHLVEDVTQDVCFAILRALPRYRERGKPFEAFVHGIASRKVADARRAMSKQPAPFAEVPESVDDKPTPEDRAVAASEAASAVELLARLPDTLRDVMLLRVGTGLSAEETGAALGMTPGAVRVAQHRALRKMRALADTGE